MCIHRWIGGTEANETLQTTLENFANENYAFAREKLAGWVRVPHQNEILVFAQ